jgi:hypothetical protein
MNEPFSHREKVATQSPDEGMTVSIKIAGTCGQSSLTPPLPRRTSPDGRGAAQGRCDEGLRRLGATNSKP